MNAFVCIIRRFFRKAENILKTSYISLKKLSENIKFLIFGFLIITTCIKNCRHDIIKYYLIA